MSFRCQQSVFHCLFCYSSISILIANAILQCNIYILFHFAGIYVKTDRTMKIVCMQSIHKFFQCKACKAHSTYPFRVNQLLRDRWEYCIVRSSDIVGGQSICPTSQFICFYSRYCLNCYLEFGLIAWHFSYFVVHLQFSKTEQFIVQSQVCGENRERFKTIDRKCEHTTEWKRMP